MAGVCMQAQETMDARIFRALLRAGFQSGAGGLGSRALWKLLQEKGSAQSLWEAEESFVRAHLPAEKAATFLRLQTEGLPEALPEMYGRAGVSVIAYTDALYPPMLKEIYNAPLLLYVQGNPAALVGRTVGIVGTRKMSEYGRQVTEKLVAELAPAQTTIVSGLAAGIDSAAHWAALHHGLPTVAVFGCGLDTIFPSNNDKLARAIVEAGGALLSEYPLGFPPSKVTFPQRNRIVAGLSYGTLVVEGDIKSGALITAKIANEEGRAVYAVPGNLVAPGTAGPHHLLKTGATPVTEGNDILKDQGWLEGQAQLNLLGTEAREARKIPPKKQEVFAQLSEEEQALYDLIPHDPVAIDELVGQSGKPASQIKELITMLELEGLIVTLPGAKVVRGNL